MNMKNLLLMLILFILPTFVLATDVRGRIDFQAVNGIYPMNGAAVQVCSREYGCTNLYYTGYDGFYYFNNIFPGPHDVLVNGILLYQVYIPQQRNFDIPPLLWGR